MIALDLLSKPGERSTVDALYFKFHLVQLTELSRLCVCACVCMCVWVNSKSVVCLQLQKNNVSQYSFKNHKDFYDF